MRYSVKRLSVITLILLAQAQLAASEEFAQQEAGGTTDEIERWVPALSVSLGLMMQRARLNVESGEIQQLEYDNPHPNPTIQPPGSGKDLMFAAIANASLELMTPGLSYIPFAPELSIPGRPRLFAHVDVAATVAQKYRIARVGSVHSFIYPNIFNITENIVTGQGSDGQAKIKTLAWSAGAGLAITLDIFERRVRIKPSVEWLREEVTVSGETRRVVKMTEFPRFASDFREIVLIASKSKVFDAIGPGLEIELESRRAGPFVLSTFMGARAHRIIGDPDVDVKATNEFGETSEYHYTNKRWIYQGFVGVRVRLVPE